MNTLKLKLIGLGTGACALLILGTGQAFAWSCEAEYSAAEDLITQAEALVKPDTDSRILALIEEAKGLADGGIINHRKAGERHTGEVGKYKHSDAMRKARWSQQLASQALFLLTGETN